MGVGVPPKCPGAWAGFLEVEPVGPLPAPERKAWPPNGIRTSQTLRDKYDEVEEMTPGRLPTPFHASSRCGAMGLAVSLLHQEADLIPCDTQWIKGSGIRDIDHNCGYRIPGLGTPHAKGGPKKKNKNKNAK